MSKHFPPPHFTWVKGVSCWISAMNSHRAPRQSWIHLIIPVQPPGKSLHFTTLMPTISLLLYLKPVIPTSFLQSSLPDMMSSGVPKSSWVSSHWQPKTEEAPWIYSLGPRSSEGRHGEEGMPWLIHHVCPLIVDRGRFGSRAGFQWHAFSSLQGTCTAQVWQDIPEDHLFLLYCWSLSGEGLGFVC